MFYALQSIIIPLGAVEELFPAYFKMAAEISKTQNKVVPIFQTLWCHTPLQSEDQGTNP